MVLFPLLAYTGAFELVQEDDSGTSRVLQKTFGQALRVSDSLSVATVTRSLGPKLAEEGEGPQQPLAGLWGPQILLVRLCRAPAPSPGRDSRLDRGLPATWRSKGKAATGVVPQRPRPGGRFLAPAEGPKDGRLPY